jgi:hypothetical protein
MIKFDYFWPRSDGISIGFMHEMISFYSPNY